MKTAVSAICHEYPNPNTTEKAKNVFSPIPGAAAMGRRAMRDMHNVPTKLAIAVAVNSAERSMPASLRILGLTISMYDIVRKVMIPANISVRTFVLFSFSLKSFSNMMNIDFLKIPLGG